MMIPPVCDDVSELNVLNSEVDSCLAFFSGDTSSNDDKIAILNVRVITCVDVHVTKERETVADIKNLTLCLVCVYIDKYKLRTCLLDRHNECNCCTN